MTWERLVQVDIERPTLRIRLAGGTIAMTIVLLFGPQAHPLAAAVVLLYLLVAAALRFAVPAAPRPALPLAGLAIDFAAVTALLLTLPAGAPVWALYAFAIGIAALRFGAAGAVVATAAAIVSYDVALIARSAGLLDLWAAQLLLAVGLIVAELTWTQAREADERRYLRQHLLALRAAVAERDEGGFLETLLAQVTQGVGAEGAGVWISRDGTLALAHARGKLPEAIRRDLQTTLEDAFAKDAGYGFVVRLATEPLTVLGIVFDRVPLGLERRHALARDLAADAAPLFAAIRAGARRDERLAATQAALRGLVAIASEQSEAGVLAELALGATALAGRGAVLRVADGRILAGDEPADPLTELARGLGTTAIFRRGVGEHWADAPLAELGARAIALAPAGSGRVVLALSAARDLTEDDLSLLRALGEAAAATTERIRESESLDAWVRALQPQVERLAAALREKEEAVAIAVHELRNPLTSMHGYAQLMARNLEAVQRQVAQLERLLADLLRKEAPPEIPAAADLARAAREAVARIRAFTTAPVRFEAPEGEVPVPVESVRLAQVLDNLLRNAVKYSPPDEPIVVTIESSPDGALLSVRDRGAGIPPEDLDRVFERFYRTSGQRDAAPGEGIGLAVCKEIVESHGGRIWATSEGPGRGSTFWVSLPIAVPAPA